MQTKEKIMFFLFYSDLLFFRDEDSPSKLDWLKCESFVLYNQLQKQRMDPNHPDNASEQTLPSERAEVVSNLSTRPNYSEQNESNFDEGLNQQRPFEIHSDRDQNYPLYSQRQPNHRTQSFDQVNNTASIHFSAPPHLNQAFFSSQRRENASQQNKNQNSAKRVFAFKNLDQDWQQEVKEKELRKEKQEEELAVLLEEDNEPLLSQKYQVDSQFSLNHDNQPLLSEHNATQHPPNNQEAEPHCQDSNQLNHELDSINEDDEKSSSQSQGARSNEVKLIERIKEIEFNDETRSERSASSAVNVEYHQPLFETNVIDDSQSNLLRFGFTRSGRKNNIIYQAQASNSLNRSPRKHEDSSHQISNKKIIPIEIDFSDISSIPVVQQQDSMTNIFSQDRVIKIQVHPCVNQNINNISKNNDIYGISAQLSNQSGYNKTHQDIVFAEKKQQNIPQLQQQVERQHPQYNIPIQQAVQQQYKQQNQQIQQKREELSHVENIPEYDWTGPPESTSIKIDQDQLQFKEEPSREHSEKNEQKNLFKKYDQQQIQVNLPSQEPEPAQSLQQITAQMYQIANDEGNGAQRTQRGAKLLKNHFDFLFFNPLSDIGRQIISDGYSVVNLINIILLKETDEALKTLLCKYLILTFAPKVATNKQVLLDYQQAMVPSSRPSKAASFPIENHIRVLPPPSQPSVEAPNSVRAVDGSSSKKQAQQSMQIDDQRLPVKRTIKTKNLDVGNQTSQQQVAKKTRKRGQKLKGRTQIKKSKVKFEEQSEKEQISIADEHVSSPLRKKGRPKAGSRSKSNRSSKKSREAQFLKQDQQVGDNFGSKFTFVLRENNRSHQKQLIQKRVSQRLANKGQSSKQKSGPSSSSQRRPSLRKPNSSKKKHYDEQDLNVSYLKKHLKQIHVKHTMMESHFRALTHQDEEIVKLLHLSDQIAAEESNSQSSSSQIAEKYVAHEEDTVSAQQSQISQRSQRSQFSNTNSLARREEFKRNVSKYKVGDIPIIILRIVDPDINNHGIYALLELGKISQLVYNARYALTPITNIARASKKHINEDYVEAQRQVGQDEKHNMAYIQPTPSTLDLIKAEKERRLNREA